MGHFLVAAGSEVAGILLLLVNQDSQYREGCSSFICSA